MIFSVKKYFFAQKQFFRPKNTSSGQKIFFMEKYFFRPNYFSQRFKVGFSRLLYHRKLPAYKHHMKMDWLIFTVCNFFSSKVLKCFIKFRCSAISPFCYNPNFICCKWFEFISPPWCWWWKTRRCRRLVRFCTTERKQLFLFRYVSVRF